MKIQDFATMKQERKKISMVTCYDYTSALIVARSQVDVILVGDSLAMTMHGHSTTIPATIEHMSLHTAAVARGAPEKFIVADMPFLSFRKDKYSVIDDVDKLMKSGAHSVKVEGVDGHEDVIEHIVKSGVPVMAHIGLTPQSIHALGGYKVQGKKPEVADHLFSQAKKLQSLGCFAIVLECIPSALAKKITDSLTIPTIGIGAGLSVDGQVLVFQDLLGLNTQFKPKFLRHFLNAGELFESALNLFDHEVKKETFPNSSESYES